VRANSIGDEVLVIRPHVPDIALIYKVGQEASVAPPITEKICTGVHAKSRFFVEHFWRKVPVSELRTLLFGALGYASIERPECVGNGLDVLTVKDGALLPLETFEPDSPVIESAMSSLRSAVESVLFSAAPR
jgi:hypothetical protein